MPWPGLRADMMKSFALVSLGEVGGGGGEVVEGKTIVSCAVGLLTLFVGRGVGEGGYRQRQI